MQLPAEPQPGQPITARWAVQVVRYLRWLTVRPLPPAPAPRRVSAPPRFFEISDASERDEDGAITAAQVQLIPSLLAQEEPTAGLTALAVADGDKIYAHVSFSTSDGSITGRVIEAGATVPDDDEGEVYLQIGSVTIADDVLTPTNLIYGPITGCRDWFIEPLTYTLEGSP